MEAEPAPRNARTPTRSTSLPAIPDALKATEELTSLLEEDDEENEVEIPPEALSLRTAFVAFSRGHDWKPQPSSGASITASSALTLNTTTPGVAGAGPIGGGLYASPSSQSVGTNADGGGGGAGVGMGLTNWMRLWADMGVPENQGGPISGTVLQTIHSAYRPHNSSRLNYLGFLQACAALSTQMRMDLTGHVSRHGAALQAEQRHQWRLQQIQQQAQAQAHAARSSRPLRSSWTAGDEDVFEANLDLTPQDVAKEIAVLAQLKAQLREQQQAPPPQQQQQGERVPVGIASLGLGPAKHSAPWRPREPPPPPPPLYLAVDVTGRTQQATTLSTIAASAAASAVMKLPVAAGAISLGGDRMIKGGGVGGFRSPQTKGAKATGGWIRGASGAMLSEGGALVPAPPMNNNPYLQGLPRSKFYSPHLRPLRGTGPGGEATELRIYPEGGSPGRGPRPRDEGVGGVPGGLSTGSLEDPDPSSSPLYGTAAAARSGLALRDGDADQAGYPMSSGPPPVRSPATGMGLAEGGKRGGGGSGSDTATLRLPALAGASRRGMDVVDGAAAAEGTAPATAMPPLQTGMEPESTVNRHPSYLRLALVSVDAGGGGSSTVMSGGTGSTSSGAAAAPEMVAALLARIGRLERAAVSAESRLAHVGSRVRSLERAEEASGRSASNGRRAMSEEAMAAVAEAAIEAQTRQLQEELTAVVQELDSRQAFLGRQVLDHHHRMAELRKHDEEQQAATAAALAEALAEARAAASAAETARQEAAAAREDAAAALAEAAEALAEAAAAKEAAAKSAEAADAMQKTAVEATATAAAAVTAAAEAKEAVAAEAAKAGQAAGELQSTVSAAAADAVAQTLGTAKTDLDERLRALDEQKLKLDEQIAGFAAQQERLLAEAAKEATDAAAAAAAAAAQPPAAEAQEVVRDAQSPEVAALAAELAELRSQLCVVQEETQAGIEAATAAAAAASAASAVAAAAAAEPGSGGVVNVAAKEGFCAQAAELRVLVEKLQTELEEVRQGRYDKPAADADSAAAAATAAAAAESAPEKVPAEAQAAVEGATPETTEEALEKAVDGGGEVVVIDGSCRKCGCTACVTAAAGLREAVEGCRKDVDEQRAALGERAAAEVRQSAELQQQRELVSSLQATMSELHARVTGFEAAEYGRRLEKLEAASGAAAEANVEAKVEAARGDAAEATTIAETAARLALLEAEVASATAALATLAAAGRRSVAAAAAAGAAEAEVAEVVESPGDDPAAVAPAAAAALLLPPPPLTLSVAVARLGERLDELQGQLDEQLQARMKPPGDGDGLGAGDVRRHLNSPGTPQASRPGKAAGGEGAAAATRSAALRTSSDLAGGSDGGAGIVADTSAAGDSPEGATTPPSSTIEPSHLAQVSQRIEQLYSAAKRVEQLYIEVNIRLEQISVSFQELRLHVDSKVESSSTSVDRLVTETTTRIEEVRTEVRELRDRTDGLAAAVASAAASAGIPPEAVAAVAAAVTEAPSSEPTEPTAADDAVDTTAETPPESSAETGVDSAAADAPKEGSDAAPPAPAAPVTAAALESAAPQPPPDLAELAVELAALRDRLSTLEQSGVVATGKTDKAASEAVAEVAAATPPSEDVIATVQRRLDSLTSEVRQSLDLTSAAISRDVETARIELAIMVSKEVAAQVAAQVPPAGPQPSQSGNGRDGGGGGVAATPPGRTSTAGGGTADGTVVRALQERLTSMEAELGDMSREISDVCKAADMTTESVELLTRHLQTLEEAQHSNSQQLEDLRQQLATGSVFAFGGGPTVESPGGAAATPPPAMPTVGRGETPLGAPGGPGAGEAASGSAASEVDVAASVAELREQLAGILAQNLPTRLLAAEASLRTAMATTNRSQPLPTAPVPEIIPDGSAPPAATAQEAAATPALAPPTPPPEAAATTQAASIPEDLQALMLELSGQVDSLAGLVREQEHGLDVLAQVAETASNSSRSAATRLDVVEASLASLAAAVRAGGGAAAAASAAVPATPPADAVAAGGGDGAAVATAALQPTQSVRPSTSTAAPGRVSFGLEAVLAHTQTAVSEMDGRLAEVEKGLEVRGAAMAALSRQLEEVTKRVEVIDGRVTDVAMDAAAAKAATAASGPTSAMASARRTSGGGFGASGTAKPVGASAGIEGEYEESPDSYGSMDIGGGNGGGGGANLDVEKLEQEWQARLKAIVKLLEGKVQASTDKAAQDVGEVKREVTRLREKSVLIDEVILKLARRLDSLCKKVSDVIDAEDAETYSVIDRERLGGGPSRRSMARQLTRSDSQESDYQAGVESPVEGPSSRVASRANSVRGAR